MCVCVCVCVCVGVSDKSDLSQLHVGRSDMLRGLGGKTSGTKPRTSDIDRLEVWNIAKDSSLPRQDDIGLRPLST